MDKARSSVEHFNEFFAYAISQLSLSKDECLLLLSMSKNIKKFTVKKKNTAVK